MIFGKGAKGIPLKKDTLFNKWCWNNRTVTYSKKKKVNLDTDLPLISKFNSKWYDA